MGSAEQIAKDIAKRLDEGRYEETGIYHYMVHGKRDGIALDVEVWWSPNSVRGWRVRSSTKKAPRLLLTARPRVLGEKGAIESGAIQAVSTNDPAFDEKFLVEGAPASVARAAMNDVVRTAMIGGPDIELDVDDGMVFAGSNMQRLSSRTAIDTGDILGTIDVVLAMRASLGELPKENTPNADAEIAELRAKREKTFARASWPAKALMIVLGAIFVIAILAGLRYGCLPS